MSSSSLALFGTFCPRSGRPNLPQYARRGRRVELEPQDSGIRDDRAIARALTGDIPGALEDLRFCVEWAQDQWPQEWIEQRQAWIEELEKGRIPFDEVTVEGLRSEQR